MDPIVRNRILRRLSAPRDRANALLRRLDVQSAFARSFCALQDERTRADWLLRLNEADQLLERLSHEGSLDALEQAVPQVEAILAPIGQAAKEYAIHCVGHGHIDMNWMWSWPETVATTHDTFASVLSLMTQFPSFTYSQSQASVYALMERYHPEMFAQIQARVREGVWEVAAAHWVEGDKNLVHGESLGRHLLYTRQYFHEKFGLSPEDVPVDWEPDTFGHANTLPGVLARGGVRFYYCCRPGGGHDHARIGGPRPPLFWWQGPDGSRVLVNRETTWYNSYINIGDNIAEPLVRFAQETGLKHWLNIYGVGNHGGGPTVAEVGYLAETMTWPIFPRVLFSTVKQYFETIEAELPSDLPVLDHELNFEFAGCYTSQSAIKRANRLGEAYCLEAETLAVVASRLTGFPAPTDRLREAWIHVLFNQFHDILPGSGVAATRHHALALFQETAALTGAIKKEAAKALGSAINTLALLPPTPEGDAERTRIEAGDANRPYEAGAGSGAMLSGYSAGLNAIGSFRPIVLWNPTDSARSELVSVDLYDLPGDPQEFVACDESGAQHPTVLVRRDQDWGHERTTLSFIAEVPPNGYRTYLLGEGVPSVEPPRVVPETDYRFQTPYFALRVDPGRSGLSELTDRRTGRTMRFEGLRGLGLVQMTQERPVGMSAWLLGPEPGEPIILQAESCTVHRVWRNGGTHAPTEAGFAYIVEQKLAVPGGRSSVTLKTTIHGLAPRLDFELQVDWREFGDAKAGIPGLEVCFDGFPGTVTTYETPFGTVDRELPSGVEVPTLRFAHGFEEYGMTVLQDSKYGHARYGNRLAFRVLRSSYEPDPTPEIGEQTVRFSVILHDTLPTRAELVRLGSAWNHPLLVIPAPLGPGSLPTIGSCARLEGDGVVLSSLKPGEQGGLIARLVSFAAHPVEARLTLDPDLVGQFTGAESVDLLERADGGSVAWSDQTLVVEVPPFGLRSVRLI